LDRAGKSTPVRFPVKSCIVWIERLKARK